MGRKGVYPREMPLDYWKDGCWNPQGAAHLVLLTSTLYVETGGFRAMPMYAREEMVGEESGVRGMFWGD